MSLEPTNEHSPVTDLGNEDSLLLLDSLSLFLEFLL